MSKLKIGVIGCGSIARFRHLPEYAANKNVEIVAVCDIVEDRVKETAETYNAKAYTNYEELLADEEHRCDQCLLTKLFTCPSFDCRVKCWQTRIM